MDEREAAHEGDVAEGHGQGDARHLGREAGLGHMDVRVLNSPEMRLTKALLRLLFARSILQWSHTSQIRILGAYRGHFAISNGILAD